MTFGFVVSVPMEQLGSHWTDFPWSMMCVWIFWKSVKKIQVSLKPDNNGYFTWRPVCALTAEFLEWEIFLTKCRENQNTHFVFSYFIKKSHHLWENVEKYCTARQVTDDSIIWHMHFACWIIMTRIQTHTQNM